MKDYYALLGVTPTASEREIRAAYRRLAFRWHPDRNPDRPEEAHRRFLDLSEALSVLGPARSRADYDRRRGAGAAGAGGSEPGPARSRTTGTEPAARPKGAGTGRERSRGDRADGDATGSDARAAESARRGTARARVARPEAEPTERELRARGRAELQRQRRRRTAVRKLARELALRDRHGVLVDATMLVATLGLAIVALVSLGLRMWDPDAILAPVWWLPLVSGLASAVAGAWFVALREQRAESYRPFAEEVIARRRDDDLEVDVT